MKKIAALIVSALLLTLVCGAQYCESPDVTPADCRCFFDGRQYTLDTPYNMGFTLMIMSLPPSEWYIAPEGTDYWHPIGVNSSRRLKSYEDWGAFRFDLYNPYGAGYDKWKLRQVYIDPEHPERANMLDVHNIDLLAPGTVTFITNRGQGLIAVTADRNLR